MPGSSPLSADSVTRSRPLKGQGGSGWSNFSVVRRKRLFPHRETVSTNPTAYGTWSYPGTQVTESEGHPFRNNKGVGKRDIGGPFYTYKKYIEVSGPVTRKNVRYFFDATADAYATVLFDFHGLVLADVPSALNYPAEPVLSNGELDTYGSTAIARCKPTNPVVSLTQALIELRREGLPSLPGSRTWRDRTSAARGAGDEYLNATFGWIPLVNDVTDFTRGVVNADDLVKSYRRNIGRPIRRTYSFPTERTRSEKVVRTNAFPFTSPNTTSCWWKEQGNGAGTRSGTVIETSDVRIDRWFSGAFTYYFPHEIAGSKRMADAAILAQRLGIEPTPELLWNIAPWSWAADWFANSGDVISNWSAFHTDGLVMLYGYMMEHHVSKITRTLVGARDASGASYEPSPVSKIIEIKRRRAATPYGFGLNFSGFSAFQSSIIAALGLSRRG